ncbi:MAG: 16S rRNA (adenine(1518)-N(6)/adenine(1519)-N(6))-dimethyltransferase RsmA [Clostridia bacterium]|nr:16S rRNA (adenine(1518)-N(6)/adenine(1519)-N(6))-dimethyltransferase RsmA [Clostridia bacterium]
MARDTREIIKKHNIRLTKSLGQNFLTDHNIVKRIVDAADVGKNDLVIEVGPGAGSMTVELAERAGRVVAVEIDKHLIPALSDVLKDYDNVELINADIMKVNLKKIIDERLRNNSDGTAIDTVKVVANLPYYITTPIIMKFLEENLDIDVMVFMVQKEVAERMSASPGGKDYGALSVAVQYYSKPERVFNVPPHCFVPQPDVDSTVIKLSILKSPPVELLDKDMFFKTVKASFGQRRKTLVNALSNSGCFMKGKEEIKQILESMGIDEKQRGETLTISQFAQLANVFSQK